MNGFTWLFVAVTSVSAGLQAWLGWRQMRRVEACRDQVPQPFADQVTLDAHRRAADYTVAGVRFALASLAIHVALLLAWTLGGGLAALNRTWQHTALGPLAGGVALLNSALLIMALLDLPLAAYHTFGIEQRFGFNRSTPRLFLLDTLKQLVLLLALAVPLSAIVLWLMHRAGTLWWLYAWCVWMAFTLIITWAYPLFIAPLFNRFSPLSDLALRTRVENLLARCGFTSRGVFVMDGSRRSAHGNAYFTGIGNNKRIVFFDTLLSSLLPEEVEAVLAHELGHFRLRHVIKGMIAMGALSLAGLGLLGWLIHQTWFYEGLGVTRSTHALALLLFLLVAPLFGFLLQPVLSHVSRRHEFEADDYAARFTDARHLISALIKLYQDNASTLTPDPLYSAFHDSHPPAPVRVGHLSTRIGFPNRNEVAP